MKILMVVAYFIPEIGSAAHVYFDLAKSFVKKGHEVDIITSYPRRFNLDKKDVDKEFALEEQIEGVKIHRCEHHAKRDNIFFRGMEHFVLSRHYFKTFKKINNKFDVCLIYIPPLPLYYFSRKIKRYSNIPSILNYQDFHPQELTDVGVMKNKLMIKIMEYIERKSYKNADFITVLTKGGIDYVIKKGGDPKKIKHIYNGVNLSDFDSNIIKKDFKQKEGIEDKILISYAGILSPFQGIDNILDLAKKLSGHEDIIFYIVGDGMSKNHLDQRVKNENINNVKLLPLQPREEYFNIINSSDISIVSLDERMKAPCLPGKMLNLLALKQPIIASVPSDSETVYVVKKSKCGIVINPGNINEAVKALLELKDNFKLRKEMGKSGLSFLEKNMNLDKNADTYVHLFQELLDY